MNIFPKILVRPIEKEELICTYKDFYRSLLEIFLLLKNEDSKINVQNYLKMLFTRTIELFDDHLKLIMKSIKTWISKYIYLYGKRDND